VGRIQADDEAGVRGVTIGEFQANFTGLASAIGATAPKVKGSTAQVEGVYLLDATNLQVVNGVNPDAQFFCQLKASAGVAASEVEFSIPGLPPGKYGFVTVRMESASPWQVSVLLRQDAGKWLLAGLYPKALTADGRDGLWFWRQARELAGKKESWAAWLYYQEAQTLLVPVSFLSSSHGDKLQAELQAAAPAAVANGLSADAPLVVKAADGTEFRVTSLGVDSTLGFDLLVHQKVDSLDDVVASRKRNIAAMAALLAAHPELKAAFHGIWMFADAPGKAPYATELAMGEIK
jgi:hypothetical protein